LLILKLREVGKITENKNF